MTYSSGGLIQATDYNGFVSTTAGANLNATWGTAISGSGYGQGNVSTVSASSTVSATEWASLVNKISAIASHQGTTITSRTAPTAGQTISVLSAVNTDLTSITTNRGFAAGSGTTSSTWTGSTAKTTATGAGNTSWSITFTHTVTFPSAVSVNNAGIQGLNTSTNIITFAATGTYTFEFVTSNAGTTITVNEVNKKLQPFNNSQEDLAASEIGRAHV